ncbi:Tm-1-like ATP-binding domain-containing protein [Anianabacter salinae]|uniref:Tm-1-like ATP-binding domain-containing protein n=1 Tax=Anianabacter salinae TaxID=2851023 RepID=UPI00225E5645|nr:Tm-1-like ATP-binding domain-containing protein [Anianabacter salinae]MBV0911143.1 Tm-1-like ATP-binding domain-containing protein [Anianabacter salinae]
MTKTILVIGTYDTKDDELQYICGRIASLGGKVLSMDVSVLGDPAEATDISKHDVAKAGGSTIAEVIALGDENAAMQVMAAGAAVLTAQLHAEGRIDGMLALGGTMGTDLALDCAQALPMGVPKVVVSTVAFSALIPADRLSPDLQMILWAGGLYGLNSVCKSSLSQAAGAVLGAAQAVEPPAKSRPVIGMTSLGSSCLKYMKLLKDPLEERGFEVAVFHATGMGGMAFEALARQGYFAAVLDLALPELGNLMVGSVANAGPDRLTNAGARGVPQIVAPGCADLIDFAGWQDIPPAYADRPFHAHNRLIKSSGLSPDERRALVRDIAARLRAAKGPVHFLMPLGGVEEWDRPGDVAHDPDGLAAMTDEVRREMTGAVQLTEVDGHINDQVFADSVLAILDGWIADGTLNPAVRRVTP